MTPYLCNARSWTHKQVFTRHPTCYSNNRSNPVMCDRVLNWDSVEPTAVRVSPWMFRWWNWAWREPSGVWWRRPRLVPVRPTGPALQPDKLKTHMRSWLSAATDSQIWSENRLLPFKVLQRFGLVRSSMDFTDWKINEYIDMWWL